MTIKRDITQHIRQKLFKQKIIILYGARQVGKTTLVKQILAEFKGKKKYFNADEPDIKNSLQDKTSTELKEFIGDIELLVIDEAQRIKNIGLTLKLIIDNYPNLQVIATGSSSFELSNEIIEPLTGRKFEFTLYPLSISEITQKYSKLEIRRLVDNFLLYGSYPESVLGPREKKEVLADISRSYILKDIFALADIRNPEVLEKLVKALALQIGSEVSYTELASLLNVDKETIARYVALLEKAFIIFKLSPFSRNLRNELKKMRKIYFWDLGLRNAVINNFNGFDMRNDKGNLWENWIIAERMKREFNHQDAFPANYYFWRTHQQQEIDLIEEKNATINAFEIKSKKQKFVFPELFIKQYQPQKIELITQDNFVSSFF